LRVGVKRLTLSAVSGLRLYTAVDGVFGFLASNGMAPYPKAKSTATLELLEKAKFFLAEGK
jgi:hypothetical protein